jgi:uncharacterized protein (DUF1778 family)
MAFKIKRLNLRLTQQQDALLRLAAMSRGESTNDIVLRQAVEAAEMVLADRRVFVIDHAAWTQLLCSTFSAPSALPEALVKLLSTSSVLERSA